MDILSLFSCFETLLAAAPGRQLAIIANAVLTMTGRITMLGISRWTEKGGSYRTVQRFFATDLPWTELLVSFFYTHLFDANSEYIVAGDATTVGKAGTQTHGIDRFFSGVVGKVVKGLEFFVFSVVDVENRTSHPLTVGQTERSEKEKAAIKQRKNKRLKKNQKKGQGAVKKGKKGRKKGSQNKDKKEFKPSSELARIDELLGRLLKLIRPFIHIRYLVLDGHFGHNQAVLMALKNGLQLISKLRRDAALYEKYTGKQSKYGPTKRYGEKLDYENLPNKYLKKSERKKDIITNYYQGIFLHREFGCELNVVVIVKINVKTQKIGHAILFSSDDGLEWENLVDYYSLRFQIEFNFRDAKQHFGLEDFMTTTATGVENAANLSFLMCQVSAKLLKDSDGKQVGINDLKTHFRGVKYAVETIKMVMEKPEAILIKRIKQEIGKLGSIHQPKIATSST